MAQYSHFLEQQLNPDEIGLKRKEFLKKISKLRGDRDVLVFASALSKRENIMIDYSDIVPFQDQLMNLHGESIDIIIETPGGFSEVVEDLVRLVRNKYEKVGIIIPGYAKSAGTIFAMAGDEILMGSASSLGPIDAQISTQGKSISAEAHLEGLNKIKKEVEETGKLNLAYIPMLERLTAGEIQFYDNALKFAKTLVKKWLTQYKFKYWTTHESSGKIVTEEEKESRAEEIANKLCSHSDWLTHNKSISLQDLKDMKLEIIDYSKNNELNEAILGYYSLLRIFFDITSVYKIYETIDTQIYRFSDQLKNKVFQNMPTQNAQVLIEYSCMFCKKVSKIQANLDTPSQLSPGCVEFPVTDNIFVCPQCKTKNNLLPLRIDIENKTSKKIV